MKILTTPSDVRSYRDSYYSLLNQIDKLQGQIDYIKIEATNKISDIQKTIDAKRRLALQIDGEITKYGINHSPKNQFNKL